MRRPSRAVPVGVVPTTPVATILRPGTNRHSHPDSTPRRGASSPGTRPAAQDGRRNRGPDMAFNPFEVFSIRSKVGRSVMAVLGLVVLLPFVLSSGAVGSKHDFVDQMGDFFSSATSRGDVVATAY